MVELAIGILIAGVLCFGFVLVVGPPYLPTLAPQVKTALNMLDLQPGQTVIELGCGDGKVLIAAAQRGWKAVGIELNPILVLVCIIRTWRYRRLVTVKWGNYWDLGLWPPAEAIFGFVLPKYMSKLDTSIGAWKAGLKDARVHEKARNPKVVKVTSFAFKIPNKRVVREDEGVFLYEY